MPRITVNLTEPGKSWAEAEADARDIPQSEVISQLVEEARGAEAEPSLTERVQRLETRLEKLENQRISENHTGSEKRTSENQPEPKNRTSANRSGSELAEAVEEIGVPGRGREIRERRREVAEEYLAWVREKGEVRRDDVIHEWVDDDVLNRGEYSDGESLWENFGRSFLQDAAGVGLVEVDGRTYRWAGDD